MLLNAAEASEFGKTQRPVFRAVVTRYRNCSGKPGRLGLCGIKKRFEFVHLTGDAGTGDFFCHRHYSYPGRDAGLAAVSLRGFRCWNAPTL